MADLGKMLRQESIFPEAGSGFRTKESLVYDFKLEGGVDRYGGGMCVRG